MCPREDAWKNERVLCEAGHEAPSAQLFLASVKHDAATSGGLVYPFFYLCNQLAIARREHQWPRKGQPSQALVISERCVGPGLLDRGIKNVTGGHDNLPALLS